MATEAPDVIDLGCGNNPRSGAVGVDIRDYPNVDVQRDIRDLPEQWSNEVSRAYSSQVFEHLEAEEIAEALAEVSRVLEPGGRFEFDVPYGRVHKTTDPTHETRWYFQTIAYYLPRSEVERLGYDRERFPDYYQPEYDIGLSLVERDATVWLDGESSIVRPASFALREASRYVTSDKWDALPLLGNLVAGQLRFVLQEDE